MIKCCIFDLDGTILDTITTIMHYVNKTLHKFGYGSITAEEGKYFVGGGARRLIALSLAHFGESDPAVIDRVLEYYDGEYSADPYYLTTVFEGINELLASLSERGIALAVLSNKQDAITKAAVSHFFPGKFDTVVGGRQGVALKPAPDAAIALISELGYTPSECAFIGDTAVDLETGRNMAAGLVIGVSWGFREREELASADVVVSTAEEVFSAVVSKG